MRSVVFIGLNTLREHLRDKLLYNLAIFGLILIGSSMLLSRLTVGEFQRVILDVGLGSINVIGLIIAVFLGIGLVSRELERRTPYLVLTKPVPRAHLVFGKYLGMALTLLLNLLLTGAGLLLVLWVMEVPVTLMVWQSLLAIYLELAVVTAIAIVFSTFTTATLSAMCTLAIFIIGHNVTNLLALGAKSGQAAETAINVLAYIVPDLEHFNLKGLVGHHVPVPGTDVLLLIGYALAYTTCLLLLAALIFQRRDIA